MVSIIAALLGNPEIVQFLAKAKLYRPIEIHSIIFEKILVIVISK